MRDAASRPAPGRHAAAVRRDPATKTRSSADEDEVRDRAGHARADAAAHGHRARCCRSKSARRSATPINGSSPARAQRRADPDRPPPLSSLFDRLADDADLYKPLTAADENFLGEPPAEAAAAEPEPVAPANEAVPTEPVPDLIAAVIEYADDPEAEPPRRAARRHAAPRRNPPPAEEAEDVIGAMINGRGSADRARPPIDRSRLIAAAEPEQPRRTDRPAARGAGRGDPRDPVRPCRHDRRSARRRDRRARLALQFRGTRPHSHRSRRGRTEAAEAPEVDPRHGRLRKAR